MRFLFGMLLEQNEKRNFSALDCQRTTNKNPTILYICLSLMSAYSEAIPILGPKEEFDSIQKKASTIKQQVVTEIKRETFGPTTKANTLWGVAKRITPKDTSIYKSMGAIYRLNPEAFENDNIHLLIPGSVLVMPTIDEIQREKVNAVSKRLLQDEKLLPKKTEIKPTVKKATTDKADENVTLKDKTDEERKNQQSSTAKETVTQKPPLAQQTQAEPQIPFAKSNIKAATSEQEQSDNNEKNNNVLNEQKITMLIQEQMDTTNQDITKLLENNHALKLRMADIQNELAMVREKQINDEPLNKEIRKFLDTERLQAEQKKEQSSFFEKLRDNPWLLFALSILPASFLILGIVFFIRYRKSKQDDVQQKQSAPQKIEETDENSNKQNVERIDLDTGFDDIDDDEELNLETEIDADELFNQTSSLEKDNKETEKDNKETPEKEAVTEEIKTENKYAELSQIAKEAEDYADSVKSNELNTSITEEKVEPEIENLTSSKDKISATDSSKESMLNENDSNIDETQIEQQDKISHNLVENNQEETIENNDKYVPSIINKNNEGADIMPFEDTDISTLSFPTVDEISLDDLGEFEEDDAFYAALAEQRELEAFLKEKENNEDNQTKLLLSDDEARLMAGLDMDALLASSFEDDFAQPDNNENEESKKVREAIQSELAKEDWSKQPDFSNEEFQRMFDETEKLIAISKKERENSLGNEQSSEKLATDSTEFSSFLSGVDLDDFDEGIEVKLETMDLAKAYIEMNDLEAAIPLLNELLESEDTQLRQEAQRLLDQLKKSEG